MVQILSMWEAESDEETLDAQVLWLTALPAFVLTMNPCDTEEKVMKGSHVGPLYTHVKQEYTEMNVKEKVEMHLID